MTPAGRIQAVIELLVEVFETPRPADGIASAYFRTRRYIGSKDRKAIANDFFRILRRYHRLSWWIKQAGHHVTARGLVAADLIFQGTGDVAAIFSGQRYAPAPLTDKEKKLVRFLSGKKFESKDMPLRERTECPEWAFPLLQESLGPRFEEEMLAMSEEAPLDLRVNTLKTTRDKLLKFLCKEGFEAEAGKLSPLCIRLQNRPPMSQHDLFQAGHFEFQDQGSQMVATLADAQPGEQVVDFCAGAGGKTLALGAAMQNKGRIVAADVLGGRLKRAKLRFRRAGLNNVETRPLTSERDKFVKRHIKHFDLVLVDAPCSGTGTWRRDPDKRWREIGPGLDELMELQKNILESAYRMVKSGGRLVYATCSLLPQENDIQVKDFLAAHKDFSLARELLQLTPARDDTDGFFIAVMERKV